MMKFIPAIVVTVCFVVVWTLLLRDFFGKRRAIVLAKPAAADVVPPNSVFHKPIGANCPAGTKLLPGYFSEKDGSRLDACLNPNGDGSIDYLNPGEGCSMPIMLQGEEPKEKGPIA